ncbi:MAG: hypothetical protein VZR53_01730 [Prevotella sp.]|jgi:hypothetical protein|nr:hypothetical protein [Prevotella sp.]
MALTLAIQTQHEVNTAVELGIVDKVTYSGKFGSKTLTVSKDDTSI